MEQAAINADFKKRYLQTPIQFFAMLGKTIAKSFQQFSIPKGAKISNAFGEKLMLAVTGVNECVYCSYLHTKTALKQGVDEASIQKILYGDFSNLPEEEAVAIAYAQHWAEQGADPDYTARKHVIEYYGEPTVKHMETFMQMVYFGNLCSNTVEAYNHKNSIQIKHPTLFKITYFLTAPIAFGIKTGGRYSENTEKQ